MQSQHKLIARLRDMAANKQGGGEVTYDHGPVRLTARLSDCDRHSVIFDELQAQAPFIDVPAAADALANGLSELDEQLALIEYDASEALGIMRSAEPLQEPDAVEYWEAELRPGDVRLTRYRKEHGAADRARQPVPMIHRSLARLADEMATALNGIQH